jgi:hypothetical protein
MVIPFNWLEVAVAYLKPIEFRRASTAETSPEEVPVPMNRSTGGMLVE